MTTMAITIAAIKKSRATKLTQAQARMISITANSCLKDDDKQDPGQKEQRENLKNLIENGDQQESQLLHGLLPASILLLVLDSFLDPSVPDEQYANNWHTSVRTRD